MAGGPFPSLMTDFWRYQPADEAAKQREQEFKDLAKGDDPFADEAERQRQLQEFLAGASDTPSFTDGETSWAPVAQPPPPAPPLPAPGINIVPDIYGDTSVHDNLLPAPEAAPPPQEAPAGPIEDRETPPGPFTLPERTPAWMAEREEEQEAADTLAESPVSGPNTLTGGGEITQAQQSAAEQQTADAARDRRTGFQEGATATTRALGGDVSTEPDPYETTADLPDAPLTTAPLEASIDAQGGRVDFRPDVAGMAQGARDAGQFVVEASRRQTNAPDAIGPDLTGVEQNTGAYMAAEGAAAQFVGAPAQAFNAAMKAISGQDIYGRPQDLLDRLLAVPEGLSALMSLLAPLKSGITAVRYFGPGALTNYLIGEGVQPEYAQLAGAVLDIADPGEAIDVARLGGARQMSSAARATSAVAAPALGAASAARAAGQQTSDDPLARTAGVLSAGLDAFDSGRMAGGLVDTARNVLPAHRAEQPVPTEAPATPASDRAADTVRNLVQAINDLDEELARTDSGLAPNRNPEGLADLRDSLMQQLGEAVRDFELAETPLTTTPPPDVPAENIRATAAQYRESAGLERVPRLPKRIKVDPRAPEIGAWYAAAEQDPEALAGGPVTTADLDSPNETRRAYAHFAKETQDQYRALTEAGIDFIPYYDKRPAGDGSDFHGYANSAAVRADLAQGRLYVYADNLDHPLLGDTTGSGRPEDHLNWQFRAVHDAFGHGQHRNQFGPQGEEAAHWDHFLMYGPEAQRAMFSETKGQNSWVNFFEDHQDIPLKDRPFAEQKAVLPPPEFLRRAELGLGPRWGGTDRAITAYDPSDLADAVRMYVEEERSAPEVADALGLPQSVVARAVRDAGVVRNPSTRGAIVAEKNTGKYRYVDQRGREQYADSPYEVLVMHQLDRDPNVAFWQKSPGKPARVPYTGSDGKHHTFSPDFYVTDHDGNQEIIEVKNIGAWRQPKWNVPEKSEAGREFFGQMGLGFRLFAEDQIGRSFGRTLTPEILEGVDPEQRDEIIKRVRRDFRHFEEESQEDIATFNEQTPAARVAADRIERASTVRPQAEEIAALHADQGGSTYNLDVGNVGDRPGYVVSVFRGIEQNFPGREVSPFRLALFIADNEAYLREFPNVNVGTWYDTEKDRTYLDLSVIVRDRAEAEALGRQMGQRAIFDTQTGESIYLRDPRRNPTLKEQRDALRQAGERLAGLPDLGGSGRLVEGPLGEDRDTTGAAGAVPGESGRRGATDRTQADFSIEDTPGLRNLRNPDILVSADEVRDRAEQLRSGVTDDPLEGAILQSSQRGAVVVAPTVNRYDDNHHIRPETLAQIGTSRYAGELADTLEAATQEIGSALAANPVVQAADPQAQWLHGNTQVYLLPYLLTYGHNAIRQGAYNLAWQDGAPVFQEPTATRGFMEPGGRNAIGLNPWSFAITAEHQGHDPVSFVSAHLADTILHELVHQSGYVHLGASDARFEDLYQVAKREVAPQVNALAERLAPQVEATLNDPDFRRDTDALRAEFNEFFNRKAQEFGVLQPGQRIDDAATFGIGPQPRPGGRVQPGGDDRLRGGQPGGSAGRLRAGPDGPDARPAPVGGSETPGGTVTGEHSPDALLARLQERTDEDAIFSAERLSNALAAGNPDELRAAVTEARGILEGGTNRPIEDALNNPKGRQFTQEYIERVAGTGVVERQRRGRADPRDTARLTAARESLQARLDRGDIDAEFLNTYDQFQRALKRGETREALTAGAKGGAEIIQRARYASMLSSPAGAVSDLFSNLLNIPRLYIRTALASAFEELVGVPQDQRSATLSELKGLAVGQASGIVQATKDALDVMLHGRDPVATEQARTLVGRRLLGSEKLATGVGLVAEGGSRLRIASDVLYQHLGETGAAHMMAYRQASREGLKGDAYAKRVQNLAASITAKLAESHERDEHGRLKVGQGGTALPDPETGVISVDDLAAEARAIAKRLIFQQEMGTAATRFGGLRGDTAIGWAIPFYKTLANIAAEGVTMSPLGIVAGTIPDLARTNSAYAGPSGHVFARTDNAAVLPASQRLADQALGILISMIGFALVLAGQMTGPGPNDERERRAWLNDGKRPYAWVSTDKQGKKHYTPLTRLIGPLVIPLAIGAAGAEAWRGHPERLMPQEILFDMAMAVRHEWFKASGLEAFSELLDAAGGEGQLRTREATRLGAGFVGSFVPGSGLLRTIERATDPAVRDPKTFVDLLKSGVPGLAGDVAPRRRATGEIVTPASGQTGIRAALPFQSTEETGGPYRYVGSTSEHQDVLISRAKDRVKAAFKAGKEPAERDLAIAYKYFENPEYTIARSQELRRQRGQ